MNPTEHLSYAERIARIGQLLSKGITLLLLDEAEEKRRGLAPDANSGSVTGANDATTGDACMPKIADDGERAIYEYLFRVHSASPRDIMRALELSKATTFRKLASLMMANLVVRSGKTSAIRYQVAPVGSAPSQPAASEPAPASEPQPSLI
jgi:hypothetical protein